MFKRFSQKHSKHHFFKLSGILLVFAAVLVGCTPVTEEASGTMCKDLKKINNLDELLYQWHANLDSDCLFVMPVADLEDVWGIKILSDERMLQSGKTDYELRASSDFYNKPYKSEVDAFFVRKRLNKRTNTYDFSIAMTQEHFENHRTLFPDGNFPKLLPKPLSKDILRPTPSPRIVTNPDEMPTLNRRPVNPGEYRSIGSRVFYWLNSDQTRIIRLDGYDSVSEITLSNNVESQLIQKPAE